MVKSALRRGLAWLAGGLAAWAAPPLRAETVTETLPVSLIVAETCHVSARPVAFPANGRDARSSVAFACSPEAHYTVTLDQGRNAAGGTRRLADATGARFVAYELYTDVARTQPWGVGAAGAVGALVPASGHVELAVFARLADRPLSAGHYADTVTVTVAF